MACGTSRRPTVLDREAFRSYKVDAMTALRQIRARLVELSRRHSRVAHEVEDLAHDILLSALHRGMVLEDEAFLRIARGAVRRHGAFLARSAGRRRTREASSAGEYVAGGDIDGADEVDGAAALSVLSPTLRTTLLLLLSGLEKAEIRAALGVTDAALRKRFQALREHGGLARPHLPGASGTPARFRVRRSQVELLPRLAAAWVGEDPARRVLATSDPDGHGLIVVELLTPARRAATPGVPAAAARPHAKGTPCSTARSRTSPSSSS
jgi:DNA-directed RNA polymerase specialized sigma24 family protein